jgi:hypothetical protein
MYCALYLVYIIFITSYVTSNIYATFFFELNGKTIIVQLFNSENRGLNYL